MYNFLKRQSCRFFLNVRYCSLQQCVSSNSQSRVLAGVWGRRIQKPKSFWGLGAKPGF